MAFAALDFGSNTLKITVAEPAPGGGLRIVEERTAVTRIGEGLDGTGRLLEPAMARTLEGLAALVEVARAHGVVDIRCVGTAGLRGAANAPVFLAEVERKLGLRVEIIDGLREAELAFRAPAEAYGPGPVVVLDVGGRSTEIVAGAGRRIDGRVSLEIGSVRLTERFIAHDPPEASELAALRAHLDAVLGAAPPVPADARLVGVSGTVLSLMGVALDLDDMQATVDRGSGQVLSLEQVRAACEDLRKKTTPERVRGTVIPPGRADVIVAGALIVIATLEHYKRPGLIVSNAGVRFGLLYELLEAHVG